MGGDRRSDVERATSDDGSDASNGHLKVERLGADDGQRPVPQSHIAERGGECMDGPCGSVVVIERDGTVHTDDEAAAPLGTVPQGTLTALDAAIKTTDFEVMRAVPFEGECPVNFDGQESLYEFRAPGGVERIASCETAVDPDHPVFAALDAALVAVELMPAP